jgi:hypothetical protein
MLYLCLTHRQGSTLRSHGLAALVIGGTVALAGCGGGDKAGTPQDADRGAILKLSCSQSWVPNERTFKYYGAWRSNSIHIGPITLMGAQLAANRDVAAAKRIKFPTLVRPNTRLTVAIAPDARSAVASYEQALPGLADVGYPMYLSVRRNACVGLTVVTEIPAERMFRRTVSIGAGHCRA